MKTRALILVWTVAFGFALKAGTVSFLADGTIDHAWSGTYPFADAGDSFRLHVSYSDEWADTDPAANLGVYLAEDLSVTLEVLGEGVVFHSVGGSVNVSLDPGEFPAFGIASTLPDGNALFFLFRDDDRSSVLDDSLPTSYGSISDYDWVGFSVLRMPPMWPSTSNPIDGTVSLLAVPEPHVLPLAGVGAALLLAVNRRRYGTQVEQTGCTEPRDSASVSNRTSRARGR